MRGGDFSGSRSNDLRGMTGFNMCARRGCSRVFLLFSVEENPHYCRNVFNIILMVIAQFHNGLFAKNLDKKSTI